MNNDAVDTIREALSFIPADDRETWLYMGMAIKSEIGEGGFDIWDQWSKTAEDDHDARDARGVWKSINGSGGITIATLYYEAQQHGFRFNGERHAITPEELEVRRRFTAERDAKEAAEIARERAEAVKKAASILKAATGDPATHPYAVKKRVPLGPLVKRGPWAQRGWDDALLVPIYGADGRVWSIEAINAEGNKDFLAGGKTAGGFHPFGKIRGAGRVLIGEGAATVAAWVAVEQSPAVAALSAGNLKAVAEAVRELAAPDADIIILADNDVKPDGSNPGLKVAIEAAAAVGGRVAIPELEGRKCDLWDMWNERGIEAVGRAIAGAMTPAEHRPGTENAPGGDSIAYRRVSDIEATPIRWLWPGRIARGKVTMLAGHPGLGKSQVTVSMAAIVTTGGKWPVDRTPCEQGSVIILSAEDDAEDTIRPRLEAAGADLTRVYIVDAIREQRKDGTPATRSLNLATDIERLGDLAGKLGGAALIVIDPITAYLGGVDSHKNAEVRGLLAPLAAMAAERDAAVVCVSHLTKAGGTEAMMRVMGSLGFVAAARAAYLVAKDPGDDRRRLFLPMKNNIAEDTGGLAFRVVGRDLGGGIVTSCVEWDAEPVTMTADEAMVPAADPEELSELEDAKTFLSGLLADGPVSFKQIRADSSGAGYKLPTIRRAQKALGIESVKEGGHFGGGKQQWTWRLPEGLKVIKNTEDAQHLSPITFSDIDHLQGDPAVIEVEV